MSSEIVRNAYYKELKNVAQKCSVSSRLLEPINAGLQEYVEQNPDCTYDDILAEFGTPQGVIDEILQDDSCVSILSQERKKRKFMIVFIPIGLVFLAIAIFLAYAWTQSHNATAGYIETVQILETTFTLL